MVNVDLGQRDRSSSRSRPGRVVGLIDDFWQRAITDVGLPGPDEGKGGKYLLLPPGYNGEVPKDGYYVLRGTMNNYNIMDRGLVENNDIAAAVNLIKSMRVYPWSERDNPKPNKFVSMSGKTMDTIPPDGIEYWARLSAFINNNPVHERDRFFMAMLKPLGIEKGKPFKPDARQRAILEDAAKVGHADGANAAVQCRAALQRRHRISRHPLALGGAHGSRPGNRHLQPARRAAALLLRRDLHVARHRAKEGRPRRELHPGLQGQGRQPLRRRQVLPPARACERAGRRASGR